MFILASQSERRIEILKENNYDFIVASSNISEEINQSLKPYQNAIKIAYNKAIDVKKEYPNQIIVAADTIVVYKNKIYGKPKDFDDAFNMLKTFSNKKHYVITAVVIISNEKVESFYEKSKVIFKKLNDDIIRKYVNSNEPFGKAGSYAIQGLGKELIKTFKGDYYNIIGFPIKKFNNKITNFL